MNIYSLIVHGKQKKNDWKGNISLNECWMLLVYVLVCFKRKSLSDGINNLHTNFPIEREHFIYRQGLRCTDWTPSHRPYIKPTIVFSFSSVVIVYCCVLYQHWTYNVRILHKDKYEPKFFVTAQKYPNIHVYMTKTITFTLNPVIDHQTLS